MQPNQSHRRPIRHLTRRGARAALQACIGMLCLACGDAVRAEPVSAPRAQALARVTAALADRGVAGQVLVGDLHDVWFARSFGLADRERGLPHRADEVWRWASVSKQVAAALVMQQVDAGRVALDDPLQKHLPIFTGPTADRITLKQLLQHTSGLPNPDDTPQGADGVPGFYRHAESPFDASALGYCAGAPKRAPGEAFDYNNCDTLVLGAMLGRLEGKSFAALVRDAVARPLGLPTVAVDEGHGRAAAVAYDDRGRPVPQPLIETFGAAGAIEGSAADLLAFDRALLSGRLLSPAATLAMWTGDPRLGFVALGAWAFEARLAGCAQPVKLVERRGDVGGIQVRNVIAPEAGVAIIFFTNDAALEFGEIWQGKGLTHDLVAAALCPADAR